MNHRPEERPARAWLIWLIVAPFFALLAPRALAQADALKQLRLEFQAKQDAMAKRLQTLESRLENSEAQRLILADKLDQVQQTDPNGELEELISELQESVGSRALAHSYDAIELNIGGFLTQTLTLVHGDDSSEASFNQTLLELLFNAKIDDSWSFFTALGWLREADIDLSSPRRPTFRDSENRTPQIISYLDWESSPEFHVRIGRYVAPMGIINIEHFPPTLLELNQPQFLRPFPGATIFPNFINGLEIHGEFETGANDEDRLKYSAFTGIFAGGSSEDFVAGGRLAYTFGSSGLTLGANYMHGRREFRNSPLGHLSIAPIKSLTSNSYDVVGADVFYDKDAILVKAEIFYSFEHGEQDRFAFYVQPAWRFSDEWIAFYRFDYLKAGQGIPSSTEHIIGVNYLPDANKRFRLEYIFKELGSGSDFIGVLQLSTTVSF